MLGKNLDRLANGLIITGLLCAICALWVGFR